MVGPIRFDGPVSGIDYTSILEKLVEAQRRPVVQFQAQIDRATERKNALLSVNIALLGFKSAADTLARPSFFQARTAVSSDESSVTAVATTAVPPGTFTFTPRRLAQTHQLLSNGYADSDTTVVAASGGTISFEKNGGFVNPSTPLSFLNGQTGFDRGSVRVVDSAGNQALLDLSAAQTVQDVLAEFNTQSKVGVKASVAGNRLVLQDTAGGTGQAVVSDVGSDLTASTLGIAKTSVSVGTNKFLFGNEINTINASTPLSVLNGGQGIRIHDTLPDFQVTPSNGAAFNVDLTPTDVTIQDVINRINTAGAAAGVTASLVGNSLVLADSGGASPISVSTLNGSFAAADLGLGVVDSAGTFTSNSAEDPATGLQAGNRRRLVGNPLVAGLEGVQRTQLNGGTTTLTGAESRGVADGTITITDREGQSVTLNVGRQVLNAKNAGVTGAGATSLTLAAAPAGISIGNRIRVQTSSGLEYRTVTNIAGSVVSFDQALVGSVNAGNAIYGLSDTLQDIAILINDRANAANVNVRVEVKAETNGLKVTDTSGGGGNLVISGTPATDLGIAGTAASGVISGADLDPRTVSDSTLLSSLNGGAGVAAGSFKVTNRAGATFNVSVAADDTLKDVVSAINAAAGSVTARLNDTGDGLLLTDTSGGGGTFKVEELGNGTTAKDLGVLGSAAAATPTLIDGSFEKRVTISANATLDEIAEAINAAGAGVQAEVIQDASPTTPYKLRITSLTGGSSGRLVVDTDIAGLSFATATAAQDAVVSVAGGGGEPQVFTSTSNTVSNVVPGLTVTLKKPSASPVSVTVSRDTEAVVEQGQRFVDAYNEVVSKIREFSFFNADTFETGPLFSDPAVRRIRRELADLVTRPVDGIDASGLNSLGEVGIRAGSEGTLTFDSATFSSKLASDFDGVEDLFILQRKLETGTPIGDLNSGQGITDAAGADFRILTRDSLTRLDIDVAGNGVLGSLLTRINSASGNGGKILARISSNGFALELVDSSSVVSRSVSAAPAPTPTTFRASEADLQGLSDDRIVGATITLTSGPNSGLVRKVSAFDTGTDVITLDSSLPVAPVAGNTYTLQRELEVQKLNGASAASELKLLGKASLGASLLAGAILNLQGDPGAAARLSETLDALTTGGDALIATRTDALDKQVAELRKSIERIDQRTEALTEKLIRDFTRLETIIAQSQSTQQRLSAFLSSLTGASGFF